MMSPSKKGNNNDISYTKGRKRNMKRNESSETRCSKRLRGLSPQPHEDSGSTGNESADLELSPLSLPLASSSMNTARSDESLESLHVFPQDMPEFSMPMPVNESTYVEPEDRSWQPTQETPFEIISEGSQKGHSKLIERKGYSYVVDRRRGRKTYWKCSVRNRAQKCPATVIEDEGRFAHGRRDHCHDADIGQLVKTKAAVQAKAEGREEFYKPARQIVEKAIATQAGGIAQPGLPKIEALMRRTNRVREKLRPQHPKQLDAELCESFFPSDFFRKDIRDEAKRQLVFATDDQIRLLANAKTWYLDGTFRVVRAPYTQLWSIHVFVAEGERIKQVPTVFAIMSGKSTRNYRDVLRAVRDLLPNVRLQEAVMDFEAAAWKAMGEVFPDVNIRGCAFHWGQALDRKVKALGLAEAYRQSLPIRKRIRQLLALRYLPAEHIPTIFALVQNKITRSGNTALMTLADYVQDTWIGSGQFPPVSWSSYNRAIRTNNDVEGWHNRFNRKCAANSLNLYVLVARLYEEAKFVPLQCSLLSEGALCRTQRKKSATRHKRIHQAWREYESGSVTVTDFFTILMY